MSTLAILSFLALQTLAIGLLIYEFRRVQVAVESFRASIQQVDKLIGEAIDRRQRTEAQLDSHTRRIISLEDWRRRVEGAA